MNFSAQYRDSLASVLRSFDTRAVEQAIAWLTEARDKGATIFTCGNGGSASTASHMACDLVKGASYQRPNKFRVLALTDFMPTISAYANDVSNDVVFAEPLRNLARPGDVLIAISGSGNSPNVLAAVEFAHTVPCRTIGLTGRDGGRLGQLVNLHINVSHPHMGRIEDMHLVISHMIGYHFMEAAG